MSSISAIVDKRDTADQKATDKCNNAIDKARDTRDSAMAKNDTKAEHAKATHNHNK